MALFKKDVLRPGRYRLPDGHIAEFTPDDVRHLHRRLKSMLSSGIAVPLAWEHQDDSKPLTAAERKANKAKYNLGFATHADLSPDGTLVIGLDVPGADDARRLPSVRFVSPEIMEDFCDGNGRKWPGRSITHLAVTARPVQHSQKPFQLVRLSLSDRIGGGKMGNIDDGTLAVSMERVRRIRAGLAKVGIELPQGVDPATDLETWLIALESAVLTKVGADEDEDEEDISEVTAPVAMSLGSWEPAKELSPSETERQILAYEKLVGRARGRGA